MKRSLALLLIALLLLGLAPAALAEDVPDAPPALAEVRVRSGRMEPAFQPDVYDYTIYTNKNPTGENHYSITFHAKDTESTWIVKTPTFDSTNSPIKLNGSAWEAGSRSPLDFLITVQSTVPDGPKYTFHILTQTPKPGTVYYPDYDEEEPEIAETQERAEPTEYLVICRLLNVRQSASTALARVGSLRRGDVVQVLSIQDGWATIVWEGGEAYVCTDYLALAPQQR